MNAYLIFILAVLAGRYLLNMAAELLDARGIEPRVPDEFKGFVNDEQYATWQRYLADSKRFEAIESTLLTTVTVIFLLAGGFAWVDGIARQTAAATITRGLVFAGILVLAGKLLALPFSAYDTFVLETRYGFNRTSPGTFVLDLLKELLLTAVIGGGLFALVTAFFHLAGALAWLWAWIALMLIQLLLVFAAPYVILPLFNSFEPLAEGPLRSALEDFAARQNFRFKDIFRVDGSRRSSKANAFFTGLGRSRRICLYDTLIDGQTVDEVVAVVAHELGHYRLGHIPRALLRRALSSGMMFFLLSLFITDRNLFLAFGIREPSIYAGLVLFGFLYSPLAMILSIGENAASRRQEYAADAYVAEHAPRPEALIGALKKLSVNNYANLRPHRLKVFLYYSHPPVLQRINRLRQLTSPPETHVSCNSTSEATTV